MNRWPKWWVGRCSFDDPNEEADFWVRFQQEDGSVHEIEFSLPQPLADRLDFWLVSQGVTRA